MSKRAAHCLPFGSICLSRYRSTLSWIRNHSTSCPLASKASAGRSTAKGRSRFQCVGANFSEYDNPAVHRLINRALAEPDRDRRAGMWAQIDRRIMRDAPMVPLLWEKASFQWASRVHGWVFDPWMVGPDPHRRVAGPAEPLTAASARVPARSRRRGDQPRSLPTAPPAGASPA